MKRVQRWWCDDNKKKNRRAQRKTCHSVTLCGTTRTGLEPNPSIRGESPPTNSNEKKDLIPLLGATVSFPGKLQCLRRHAYPVALLGILAPGVSNNNGRL